MGQPSREVWMLGLRDRAGSVECGHWADVCPAPAGCVHPGPAACVSAPLRWFLMSLTGELSTTPILTMLLSSDKL